MKTLFGVYFLNVYFSLINLSQADQNDFPFSNACAQELNILCGMDSFPETMEGLYKGRECLNQNIDNLTPECSLYLNIEQPDFIKACESDIRKHCSTNYPEESSLRLCLTEIPDDEISLPCKNIVSRGQKLMEETVYNNPKEDIQEGSEVSFLYSTPFFDLFQNIWNKLASACTRQQIFYTNPNSDMDVQIVRISDGNRYEQSTTFHLRGAFTVDRGSKFEENDIFQNGSGFQLDISASVEEAGDDDENDQEATIEVDNESDDAELSDSSESDSASGDNVADDDTTTIVFMGDDDDDSASSSFSFNDLVNEEYKLE